MCALVFAEAFSASLAFAFAFRLSFAVALALSFCVLFALAFAAAAALAVALAVCAAALAVASLVIPAAGNDASGVVHRAVQKRANAAGIVAVSPFFYELRNNVVGFLQSSG